MNLDEINLLLFQPSHPHPCLLGCSDGDRGRIRRLRTIEEEAREIEAVTMDDIRRVLDRFRYTEKQVFLGYGPVEAPAFNLPDAMLD